MTTFSKPFCSPDEHIALLQARGMDIPDQAQAKVCLKRIGYYRLSAYWYPFRASSITPGQAGKRDQVVVLDTFRKNTSFNEIIDFYVFDKGLRLLVSDALERIEITLRAQIANQLGSRDRWAHRNSAELHGDFTSKLSPRNSSVTMHHDWLLQQDKNFDRSKEDFAKHFRNKYTLSPPPIWIASEVWDWGMLSHFYSGMKHSDKDAISNIYGALSGKEFVTWVRALNDLRNICAHHSRLWNRALTVQLKMPRTGTVPVLDHIIGNTSSLTRVYGALVIMNILMKTIHPKTNWHKRLQEHIALSPKNLVIDIATAGFPKTWRAEAIWL